MGWDGDDLAGSMEDALDRQQAMAEERARSSRGTPETRARNAEIESLRLSRSRISSQLSNATNPAHRKMLESALKSIDEKIEAG
jgi:hypothetical protein